MRFNGSAVPQLLRNTEDLSIGETSKSLDSVCDFPDSILVMAVVFATSTPPRRFFSSIFRLKW